MTRVVVLVSGGGTNLQALLDAQGRDELGSGKIVAVLSSNPAAYALERAKAAHVPGYVVARRDYPDSGAFSLALLEECRKLGAQLIVLAGFLHILTKDFVDAYPNAILNVHPSLIPSFCGKGMYGLRVHEAALARGVKVTGATVHFVNAEPDGGPILMQKAVEVLPDDTPARLQRRVMEEAEWVLLPQAVALVCSRHVKGEETL